MLATSLPAIQMVCYYRLSSQLDPYINHNIMMIKTLPLRTASGIFHVETIKYIKLNSLNIISKILLLKQQFDEQSANRILDHFQVSSRIVGMSLGHRFHVLYRGVCLDAQDLRCLCSTSVVAATSCSSVSFPFPFDASRT